MSAVQNNANLGVTSLTPEYKNTSDNNAVTNMVNKQDQKLTADSQSNTLDLTPKKLEESEAEQPLTVEQLDKVAQQLQDFVGDLNRNIEFSVDEDSGRDVIKVIDKDSGDILKQYPSEEVLTLVSKLSDMVGGFVDTKV